MSKHDGDGDENHISIDRQHHSQSHSQSQSQSQHTKQSSSDIQQSYASPSHQTSDEGSSQHKSSGSESTDFTSPSKSLKSFFFKNRLSSYSIDSIPEHPELEGSSFQQQLHAENIPPLSSSVGVSDRNKKSSIGSVELTPTKSPRLMNFSLRPIFMRSRSSGVSEATTGSNTMPQQPYEIPISINPQRKTTIEDFADTDSDTSETSGDNKNAALHHGDGHEEYEHDDSINSLLQEYNYRYSGADQLDRTSKQFIFKEVFDDSSVKTNSRPTSKIFSTEENEDLKDEITRQGSNRSSGSNSLKQTKGGIHRSAAQQQFIDTHLAQQHLGETRKQIQVIDPLIPQNEPSSATTLDKEEGDEETGISKSGEHGEISNPSPTVLKRVSRVSNDSSSGASAIGISPSQYNENRNSIASSINSQRFRLHNDKIEPIREQQQQQQSKASKHISTSTTFAEAESAAAVLATVAGAVDSGTDSGNSNPTNGSSLRASLALSDDSEYEVKYPEPTITPSQTPRVPKDNDSSGSSGKRKSSSNNTSSISYEAPGPIAGSLPRSSSSGSSIRSGGRGVISSKQPTPTKQKQSRLQEEQNFDDIDKTRATTIIAGDNTSSSMFNETMIKNSRHISLGHSSMSSGELLQNLEHSYDYSKSQDNSGNSEDPSSVQPVSSSSQQQQKQKEGSISKKISMSQITSASATATASTSAPTVYQFNVRDSRVSPPIQLPPVVSQSPYEQLAAYDSLDEADRRSFAHSIEIPISDKESVDARDITLVGENMTAGLDSSNDLPVMLFKVQDRDKNTNSNSNQTQNQNQNQNQNRPQYIDDENSVQSSGTGVNTSGSTNPSSGDGDGAAIGVASTAAAVTSAAVKQETRSSRGSDNSIKNIINHHFKNIGDSVSSRNRPALVVVGNNRSKNTINNPNNGDSNTNQLHTFDEKELIEIPTPIGDIESQENEYNEYPWLNWWILMIFGILMPPIFFLVPLGVLDGGFNGLRYADKKYRLFNKKQKMISFILGIIWILVVLAMIGVGFGIGLTRNSS